MRHRRTRNGCLTCRSRRKKCDEVKPRCAGCRRNQLPCTWPSAGSCSQNDIVTNSGNGHSSLVPVPSIPPPVSNVHRGADTESPPRACMLTPQSVNLLSHFIVNTAHHFAMGPMHQNPFVSILVPLASADDLLMHALLTVSGAYLSSSNPDLAICEDITRATSLHYSRLIAGLRSELWGLRDDDLEKRERLLRLLLILCHYEAVSGDGSGAIFDHLGACHHLITSLLAHKHNASQGGHLNLNMGSQGFSIEIYVYMMLCNMLVMPAKLQHSATHALIMPFNDMAHYSTFGSLFAGAHGLYQLIPEIQELASLRFLEEAAGVPHASATLEETYAHLHSRLSNWQMPLSANRTDWEVKNYAAEVWRHALHIYLIASLAGSVVQDPIKPIIASHTVEVFTLISRLLASQKHYVASLLWPALVGASCISQADGQHNLVWVFRTTWSGMGHMGLWADILQLLWDDPDPRSYGPHGLVFILQKHERMIGII